jgi:carbonic anhydrase
MDARVDPLRILGAGLGEVHVIRNAGGIVTVDTIRSLLLSQRKLGTDRVLVMMHTDCGVLGLDDEKELDEIEAEVGQRPALNLGGFTDIEARLRDSVETVRSTSYLPSTDQVSGAIYDVGTGRLRKVL